MSETKLEEYLRIAANDQNKIEHDGIEWLWKRSAAAALETSEKNLERKAQSGKIKQIEVDRKTYYSIPDLLSFELEKGKAVIKPTIQTDDRQTELQLSAQNFNMENFALALNSMVQQQVQLALPAQNSLAALTGKRRIDADEFAEALGMLKSKVKAAIRAAEDAEKLNRFAGLRNKAVYNCDDLDVIAAQLLADDQPIEIKKPNFEKKAQLAKAEKN